MERIVAEALHRACERWIEATPLHGVEIHAKSAEQLVADLREAGWTLVPVRPGAAKEDEWP